jgi:hypothetical protein
MNELPTQESIRAERYLCNPFQDWREYWQTTRREMYDADAPGRARQLERHSYYYEQLRRMVLFVVGEGRRVLCLPSDLGQYLAWVNPSRGVGVDSSPGVIQEARRNHPEFEFHQAETDRLPLKEKFDFIIIPNGVNDQFDVQGTFKAIRQLCEPETRVVLLFYNFLWQPLVLLAEKLSLKRRQPPQNWLSTSTVESLLRLEDFEAIQVYRRVIFPIYVPLLSEFLNSVLAALPLINRLCFVEMIVARPTPAGPASGEPLRVSVVVPCKNERGNIEGAVRRTPAMGAGTELIFCDDRSTDGTADEVRRMQNLYPEKDIKLFTGPGISKAQNVWTGFDSASGDILMILDGDLAVPPEELPRFYRVLAEGKGEFVNGSRMVFPMRDQAMRLANVFGNKIFGILFSYILRQNITDTLCGTKALWRTDYEGIRGLRGSWGIEDRWGDYELIFGAAKLHLKIAQLPVHYMERQHGTTKMTGRLRNAAVMIRMCWAAHRRFIRGV